MSAKVHSESLAWPAWVDDLLGVWAGGERASATSQLGWARVSPMFARLGEAEEADADASYSPAEVRAIHAAVERLQHEQPAEWRALLYRFKPWTIRPLDLEPAPELVPSACRRLATWVDELVDGPTAPATAPKAGG